MESNCTDSAVPEQEDRSTRMEAVMAQYETALLRYATRIVRDAHLAQDVVQNAFIKLYANWKDNTRPDERLKTWLYRVTHNEAIDLIRRESRLQILHKAHSEEQDACTDGVNCPRTETERFALVMDHVGKLDPTERQVLLLRLEEGLSYGEIAAVTGRSVGNIGCILHNAVKTLSKHLRTEVRDQKSEVSLPCEARKAKQGGQPALRSSKSEAGLSVVSCQSGEAGAGRNGGGWKAEDRRQRSEVKAEGSGASTNKTGFPARGGEQ